MIYNILKILCRITIFSYFKRVKVSGKSNIPKKGPYIFVANHPSAFMDPIVVATFMKPQVYFIAAGEYVGGGLKAWFFKKALHMIPVFRPSTRPEDVHKNKNMFAKCYDHLISGNSLLVFPEGVSITELKLKPLKTGVARIARGAELKANRSLNISIVPIGLNYSDPHSFRSDLFIQIGEAINVNDLIGEEGKNETAEVKNITQIMELKLREMVLHIDAEDDESFLSKLNLIYSRDIKNELGIENNEQSREFNIHKDMILAIEYYKAERPLELLKIREDIDTYLSKLESSGLSDHDIYNKKIHHTFFRILSLFIGFPFFVAGVLNNGVPYFFVRFLVHKLNINQNFLGSIILASGLFSYLIWYAIVVVSIILFTPIGWYGMLYPIVMYSTGIYALIYGKALTYAQGRKSMRKQIVRNKHSVDALIQTRKDLIQRLDQARFNFQENLSHSD